jgi:hypothetical protein
MIAPQIEVWFLRANCPFNSRKSCVVPRPSSRFSQASWRLSAMISKHFTGMHRASFVLHAARLRYKVDQGQSPRARESGTGGQHNARQLRLCRASSVALEARALVRSRFPTNFQNVTSVEFQSRNLHWTASGCGMKPSNHSMKPTAAFQNKFSMFATTPCRGLSLSR